MRRSSYLIALALFALIVGVAARELLRRDQRLQSHDSGSSSSADREFPPEVRADLSTDGKSTDHADSDLIEAAESPADSDDEDDDWFVNDTFAKLTILVCDTSGKPRVGQEVKLVERWDSMRSRFGIATTRANGMASFPFYRSGKIPSERSAHQFFAELADYLLPAPELRVTTADLDDPGLVLVDPPSGRLEIVVASTMPVRGTKYLQVSVVEESPGGTQPGNDEDISTSDWTDYRFSMDLVGKDWVGNAFFENGPSIVFKESHFGRTFTISLFHADSTIAQKHGVRGPSSVDEVVTVEFTPADLVGEWFGLHLIDEAGRPLDNWRFGLFDDLVRDYIAYFQTDDCGDAIIEKWRLDGEEPTEISESASVSLDRDLRIIFESPAPKMVGLLPRELRHRTSTSVTLKDLKVLVSGKVLASDGLPLANATIEARSWSHVPVQGGSARCICGLHRGRTIKTRPDGTFEIVSECGHQWIEFTYDAEREFIRQEIELPRRDVILRTQRRTFVKGTIALGKYGRFRVPMSINVIRKDEDGREQEQTIPLENEDGLDVVPWSLTLDDHRTTTVAFRLHVCKEEFARSPEFTPNGENIEIPPFDVRDRLRVSRVRVLGENERPLRLVDAQIGNDDQPWVRLDTAPLYFGWFDFIHFGDFEHLAVRAAGYHSNRVKFAEGMTVVLEPTGWHRR